MMKELIVSFFNLSAPILGITMFFWAISPKRRKQPATPQAMVDPSILGHVERVPYWLKEAKKANDFTSVELDPDRMFGPKDYEVLSLGGEQCAHCGTKTGPFHMDHIIPHSKGGRTDLMNAQLLCAPCNLSKGNKNDFDAYLENHTRNKVVF